MLKYYYIHSPFIRRLLKSNIGYNIMKKTIAQLTTIAQNATDMENAAQTLSAQVKRLSKQAAKKVMLDVNDFLNGNVTEQQLSLYLVDHGFKG